jgi:hypothetical protein
VTKLAFLLGGSRSMTEVEELMCTDLRGELSNHGDSFSNIFTPRAEINQLRASRSLSMANTAPSPSPSTPASSEPSQAPPDSLASHAPTPQTSGCHFRVPPIAEQFHGCVLPRQEPAVARCAETTDQQDPIAFILQLHDLHRRGVLSEDEFVRAKAKALGI